MDGSGLRAWWDALLDLVYPVRCVVCDRLNQGEVCSSCLAAVLPVEPPFCPRCQSPNEPDLCPGCRADPPAFTVARAAGPFEEPLRMAIHALKYQGKERVAPSLAELLVEAWKREPILHSAEVVIPLPIHQKREKDRGFNQSALLSRDLAASLSLPLFDRVLTRPIHRQPQVGLGRAERRENVSGVFAVEYPALVRGRSLLLVDDVLTTGATCHEAARTLLDAGAAEVKVLALAREPYRRDGSHQL